MAPNLTAVADGLSSETTALNSRKVRAARGSRCYTMEEISKHNNKDSLWLAISGKVYDVTNWISYHPGTEVPLLDLAGKDCTEAFNVFHPQWVLDKKLPRFQVGVVYGYEETAMQKDFNNILKTLDREGKFDTEYSYYGMLATWYATLLAAAIYWTVTGTASWHYAVGALFLGLFWQQAMFLGHDLGHNAVTHNRDTDMKVGFLATSLLGISIAWWKRSHNTHHVVTNSVDHDPDIQHLPAFAVDPAIFKGFWSTYHLKQFTFDLASRYLVPNQHYLYYPIMALARVNLYIQSFILLLNPNIHVENRMKELAAMAIFFSLHGYLLSFLPSKTAMVGFSLLANAVAGLIHVQITLSHFAMDTYMGPGYAVGDQGAYIKNQVATTMDVDCPWWMDWFHGGLQFQLEHHLIPRLPRHNLRYAMEKHIKPFCAKHGLDYQTYSFLDANKKVFNHMKKCAEAARAFNPSESIILAGLNAEG